MTTATNTQPATKGAAGVDPYYLTHKAETVGYIPQVILAVAHQSFRELNAPALLKLMKDKPVLIDVKSIFNAETLRNSGITVWRL